jgi:D-alanine transaminase
LTLEQLRAANEVFLCSTTLLVMPVVAVDDQPIAQGKPGPIALDLAARLRGHLELAG